MSGMRLLAYWRAEYKDKEAIQRVGWYGRVRDGTVRGGWRYFGPHASRLLLIDAAYKAYGKQNLRFESRPAWFDIGPPGWIQGGTT